LLRATDLPNSLFYSSEFLYNPEYTHIRTRGIDNHMNERVHVKYYIVLGSVNWSDPAS